MEDGEEQNITFARRAVVSRRLFFSHKIVRPLFAFACIDVVVALIFAIIPDTRMADNHLAGNYVQVRPRQARPLNLNI